MTRCRLCPRTRCGTALAVAAAAVLAAASASAAPVPPWTGAASMSALIGWDADHQALDGPLGAVPQADAAAATAATPVPAQQQQQQHAVAPAVIAAAVGQWPAELDSGGTGVLPNGDLAARTVASASGAFVAATTRTGTTGGLSTAQDCAANARPASEVP